jgi:hypothetical protein
MRKTSTRKKGETFKKRIGYFGSAAQHSILVQDREIALAHEIRTWINELG